MGHCRHYSLQLLLLCLAAPPHYPHPAPRGCDIDTAWALLSLCVPRAARYYAARRATPTRTSPRSLQLLLALLLASCTAAAFFRTTFGVGPLEDGRCLQRYIAFSRIAQTLPRSRYGLPHAVSGSSVPGVVLITRRRLAAATALA